MAQLLVRNLDEALVDALRMRAAKRGHSVEEEHRRILRRALLPKAPKRTLVEHLLAIPPSRGPEEDDLFAFPRELDSRPDPFADEGEG